MKKNLDRYQVRLLNQTRVLYPGMGTLKIFIFTIIYVCNSRNVLAKLWNFKTREI